MNKLNCILGSHNSLSYLPIKKWWQKITSPWTKCQNLTLLEQYNAGVRLFDIRVRIGDSDKILFCHNRTILDLDIESFYKLIEELPGNIYIRFGLDERTKPEFPNLDVSAFLDFVKEVEDRFKDKVKVVNEYVFWIWIDLYEGSNKMYYYEPYASVSNTFYKYLPPKWFANIFNKQVMNMFSFKDGENTCVLLDYVK